MGLDNGITLKTKKRLENLPEYLEYFSWEKPDCRELEIVYFRKCWGLRYEVNDVTAADNNGKGNVTLDNIDDIINILNKYTDEEYYENNADSIWEYDEYMRHYDTRFYQLHWLKKFLAEHPEEVEECYWYDSY